MCIAHVEDEPTWVSASSSSDALCPAPGLTIGHISFHRRALRDLRSG